jgi:hypothetical protein
VRVCDFNNKAFKWLEFSSSLGGSGRNTCYLCSSFQHPNSDAFHAKVFPGNFWKHGLERGFVVLAININSYDINAFQIAFQSE